jgi:hypothetical protein
MQIILWTFAGWGLHCTAERCRRDLQTIHADNVPESITNLKTDQLVCPVVVSYCFAQVIGLSDD